MHTPGRLFDDSMLLSRGIFWMPRGGTSRRSWFFQLN